MTKDTLRLLIENPGFLTQLPLEEFVRMTPRELKDIPEPKLLVTHSVVGEPLAIVFPYDDYLELCNWYRRIMAAVEELTNSVMHA